MANKASTCWHVRPAWGLASPAGEAILVPGLCLPRAPGAVSSDPAPELGGRGSSRSGAAGAHLPPLQNGIPF